MAVTYSDLLKMRKVDKGDKPWDEDINENTEIIDVVLDGLLGVNYVNSGLAPTDGGVLEVDYAIGVVCVAGVFHSVAGGSKTCTDDDLNWLYVDSAGTMQINVTPPTGNYVPIAFIDCSSNDIDRIGDLRNLRPIIPQIKFPATQAPSADPNTLDDYEEGDHVATITCSTSGSYVLGNDTLTYTKIGRLVHLQGRLAITNESSPNGKLRISLPFVTATLLEDADNAAVFIKLINHGDGGIENPYASISAGVAYVTLFNVTDAGGEEDITHARVDATFDIDLSITFMT